MPTAFNKGDTVYLDNGQEAEYASPIGDRHVVTPVYQHDGNGYDEPPYEFRGDEKIVSRVHSSAPVEKIHQDIKTAKAELTSIKSELSDNRVDLNRSEEEIVAAFKELEQYSGLERLRDVMAGKVTHVVTKSLREYQIKSFDEAMEYEDDYERTKKRCLLGLFGRYDKPQWGINQYPDGSGIYKDAWMCFSEEEANAKINSLLAGDLEDTWKGCDRGKKNDNSIYQFMECVKRCLKREVSIPDDMMQCFRREKAKRLEDNMAKARGEIEKYQAKLAEMLSEHNELTRDALVSA